MRKIKRITLLAVLAIIIGGTRAFAQGYPVLDVSNLLQNIESVYQYYQQIQNTIEQVQNTYKQIDQAAQQMQSMNWDDLKNLGENFSGMGDNPFEVITGVRNSAQDITKAVNKNMNKINDLHNSLTKESISFGGMKVSVADLCGAGDPNKTATGFVKNAWEYTTDAENGAFSDAVKAWTGKLTYKQRRAIAKKYGMSANNYATLSLANYQLNELVKSSNIESTIQGQQQQAFDCENDANALGVLAQKVPDGSVFAATQMVNSSLGQVERGIGNLGDTLNKIMGLTSQKIMAEKSEQAVEQQKEADEKEKNKEEHFVDNYPEIITNEY